MTDVNGSEPPPQQVLTLFLVVVDHDGSSRVVLAQDQRYAAARLATPKDVFPALANCLADWQGMKTAEAVMSMQLMMSRQQVPQEGESKDAEAL